MQLDSRTSVGSPFKMHDNHESLSFCDKILKDLQKK